MDQTSVSGARHLVTARVAVGLTLAMAVIILFGSFFRPENMEHLLLANHQEINHVVQRLVGIFLFAVAWELYQRKRVAWIVTIFVLGIVLVSQLLHDHAVIGWIVVAIDIVILVLLLISRDQFRRMPDRPSTLRAVIFGLVAICVVLLTVVFGYFRLRSHTDGSTFGDALVDTLGLLVGINPSGQSHPMYETFAVVLIWVCVVACLFFILRSAFIHRTLTHKDRQRARVLVNKYGQNCCAYLTLEDDKLLYFGRDVDGVIAYGVVGDVIVVSGDPICAPEDFTQFLAEFKGFCHAGSYQCFFMNVMPDYLPIYTSLGFGNVKCGEEARIDLTQYSLKGGKIAKLRADINHANKELETREYRPLEGRDEHIEKQIEAVSNQWMEGKKSSELAFTVGGVGLEDPMDRRYFYAVDKQERIIAFHVYLPYAAGDGYLADVTRRVPKAPGGVTEKLNYDAFMTFRDEGVHWASLGLAPLASVREGPDGESDDRLVTRLLSLLYEKGNGFYGFKDLRRAKERYAPTEWVPGYFVYSGSAVTAQMVYAAISIQNSKGFGDFVSSFLKGKAKPKVSRSAAGEPAITGAVEGQVHA